MTLRLANPLQRGTPSFGRVQWWTARAGVDRYECGLGASLIVHTYDGAVLELWLHLLSVWCRVRLRLFYSAALEQHAADRWAAEQLAGEHPGITVQVSLSHPPDAGSS